ncbi:uncharacterized protein LOC125034250 isoform X2 [Penaeus chinensis]|nr:uncharacterized protein LOC125034250 isoform X2 [Penaeus chinensis]
MFPRHSPPMHWAPRSYVAPSAEAHSQRGTPPLSSGQESQWFTPSSLPVQSYQQFHGRHQVPPRPTGYPVARVLPGTPTPIDPRKKVVLGRHAVPQVSDENNSDVLFLGCKRNLSRQVRQTASTSIQPRTGNEVQEIRQFMGVMQQHTHNMQVPHCSQTERPTYQSQNCGYSIERRDNILQSQNQPSSVVNPQHNPGLPWHQSPESSQSDMNQLRAKASSASLESSCIRMPLESSSFPFKIPIQRDHITVYSSTRSLHNSGSNVIESASRVNLITNSEIITSPDNNMQLWSVPSPVSVHPTHLNSNSNQQLSGITQQDAHESSWPVTDLLTAPNDKAHFKPQTWSSEAQTIGDPSSEIITSPDNNMQLWSVPSPVSVHPTHLNSNSNQQLSGITQQDAHESSWPVTDLLTAPNDKAHFKPQTWSSEAQTIGDPSSEIITSPDNNMQLWSVPSAVSVHPTHLNSNSNQQLSGITQQDAHESSWPVTDLLTVPNDKAHFKPQTWSSEAQTIGDPTVSSTIKSPVLNQHEESLLTTSNEKTDTTENAVDARKNSDVPNVNLLKPRKRMFSRKGKCLSGLFRKAHQGFPQVSFDYEIYCFLCGRMAAGNNVYEHMFFGNLKCIECAHIVRSCEDFKIVRHSNVECGVRKGKHRLASWADCPVEFFMYSVKQSLVPNRLEDCSPLSTSDVTTELRKYMKKLSLLRFYKPWRSAFRRCSEYVKSMNRTEIDSVLPEDTQKVINREVVDSIIPGDTEEEIMKEKVNSDAQEEINMKNVRCLFPGETQAEINKEINSDMQKDTHKEMSRQEISRDMGRITFYDLISSQSERQEEPQMEGISINEALEPYQENSLTPANNTVIVHPSTSARVITGAKQDARESTSNLQMFENVLQDGDKDAHDNDTSQVSSDQFENGDTTGTYIQDLITDTQQQSTLWEPDGDDTHASLVEETETRKSFHDERKSENQLYERSFELSERLSSSSLEPEDNQVIYYYPSETPPEECPMCYYTLCATMFTLNTTNFRVSTECPDCSLKICIVLKDSVS